MHVQMSWSDCCEGQRSAKKDGNAVYSYPSGREGHFDLTGGCVFKDEVMSPPSAHERLDDYRRGTSAPGDISDINIFVRSFDTLAS